jgi:hypothetical protein
MTGGILFRMSPKKTIRERPKILSHLGFDWLGRQDSNLGMAESKSAALPLGYAPKVPSDCRPASGGRTITTAAGRINAVRAAPSDACRAS